jgi:hypothetical protein
VPTVLLIRKGKGITKFNLTEITLATLQSFVQKWTNLQPEVEAELVDSDHKGPVPTVLEPSFDFLLAFSTCYVLFLFVYFMRRSFIYRWLIDSVRNTWNESQHQHVE